MMILPIKTFYLIVKFWRIIGSSAHIENSVIFSMFFQKKFCDLYIKYMNIAKEFSFEVYKFTFSIEFL